MLRAIREIQPAWVVGENVIGLTHWNGGLVFDQVQADLENEGYEVIPFVLPACGVNAPHKRDRVWFIAYSSSNGHKSRGFGKNRQKKTTGFRQQNKWERIWSDFRRIGKQGITSNTYAIGLEGVKKEKITQWAVDGNTWDKFPTQSPICSGDDELPTKLDGITFSKWRSESIKAYGNAIVPQVAFQIFKAIEIMNNEN